MKFVTLTLLLSVLVRLACSRGNRVVGGFNISIEKAPYQISLEWNLRHHCGGSIIAPKYIVTASHCVMDRKPEVLRVRAGTSLRGKGGQVKEVKKINMHPNFVFEILRIPDYDIAVLELANDLVLGKNVGTIKLPKKDDTWAIGTDGLISGWGRLTETAVVLPVHLQGAIVKLIDFKSCSKAYDNWLTPHMFCAGVEGGGVDACQYDSGSPLQIDGILIGVVVYGHGCARPDYPGVYTNVFSLIDFVHKIIGASRIRTGCF